MNDPENPARIKALGTDSGLECMMSLVGGSMVAATFLHQALVGFPGYAAAGFEPNYAKTVSARRNAVHHVRQCTTDILEHVLRDLIARSLDSDALVELLTDAAVVKAEKSAAGDVTSTRRRERPGQSLAGMIGVLARAGRFGAALYFARQFVWREKCCVLRTDRWNVEQSSPLDTDSARHDVPLSAQLFHRNLHALACPAGGHNDNSQVSLAFLICVASSISEQRQRSAEAIWLKSRDHVHFAEEWCEIAWKFLGSRSESVQLCTIRKMICDALPQVQPSVASPEKLERWSNIMVSLMTSHAVVSSHGVFFGVSQTWSLLSCLSSVIHLVLGVRATDGGGGETDRDMAANRSLLPLLVAFTDRVKNGHCAIPLIARSSSDPDACQRFVSDIGWLGSHVSQASAAGRGGQGVVDANNGAWLVALRILLDIFQERHVWVKADILGPLTLESQKSAPLIWCATVRKLLSGRRMIPTTTTTVGAATPGEVVSDHSVDASPESSPARDQAIVSGTPTGNRRIVDARSNEDEEKEAKIIAQRWVSALDASFLDAFCDVGGTLARKQAVDHGVADDWLVAAHSMWAAAADLINMESSSSSKSVSSASDLPFAFSSRQKCKHMAQTACLIAKHVKTLEGAEACMRLQRFWLPLPAHDTEQASMKQQQQQSPTNHHLYASLHELFSSSSSSSNPSSPDGLRWRQAVTASVVDLSYPLLTECACRSLGVLFSRSLTAECAPVTTLQGGHTPGKHRSDYDVLREHMTARFWKECSAASSSPATSSDADSPLFPNGDRVTEGPPFDDTLSIARQIPLSTWGRDHLGDLEMCLAFATMRRPSTRTTESEEEIEENDEDPSARTASFLDKNTELLWLSLLWFTAKRLKKLALRKDCSRPPPEPSDGVAPIHESTSSVVATLDCCRSVHQLIDIVARMPIPKTHNHDSPPFLLYNLALKALKDLVHHPRRSKSKVA